MPRGRKPSNTTTNSLPKKSPKQQKEEEIQNEWLSFASDSFVGESLRNKKSSSNMRMLTKAQINNMLLNPVVNYEGLQNLSQLLKTKSNIYQRLLQHFAYMFCYSTLLIPTSESSSMKNKQKTIKSFESAALYLEKLNPKTNLPQWADDWFTNGEKFLYKIEDRKSIEFKTIPNKYCLPYCKTEGVMRYVIDMQKFSSGEDVSSYPKEIQKAYELYKDGNKDRFIDGQYYEVSNNGFCFTFNHSGGGHAIPMFSGIFNDLVNLDEAKILQLSVDRLNNTKMVHNRIPMNKNDMPCIPPDLAKKYNEAIKNNLGAESGVFSITNPFQSEVLNLNNNAQRTTTLVEDAVRSIFDNAGVSSLIFNNEKASGEALIKSIIADSCVCINTVLNAFSDYLSWECSNLSKNNWKCLVMPFTYFNIDSYRTSALNEMAYGGSRSYFLSTCNLTPLQSVNLLKMEQAIGIDSLLVPAQSSHTQSDKGGRPESENKSDITDLQNETQ